MQRNVDMPGDGRVKKEELIHSDVLHSEFCISMDSGLLDA